MFARRDLDTKQRAGDADKRRAAARSELKKIRKWLHARGVAQKMHAVPQKGLPTIGPALELFVEVIRPEIHWVLCFPEVEGMGISALRAFKRDANKQAEGRMGVFPDGIFARALQRHGLEIRAPMYVSSDTIQIASRMG